MKLNRRQKIRFLSYTLVFVLILLLGSFAYSVGNKNEGYSIAGGGTFLKISDYIRDAAKSGYGITNSSIRNYFIPTKTLSEFNSFRDNLPSGVSICDSINGSCGGANGHSYQSASAANSAGLCSIGNPSPSSLSGNNNWSWACQGTCGGSNSGCSATYSLPNTVCSSNWSPNNSMMCTGSQIGYIQTGDLNACLAYCQSVRATCCYGQQGGCNGNYCNGNPICGAYTGNLVFGCSGCQVYNYSTRCCDPAAPAPTMLANGVHSVSACGSAGGFLETEDSSCVSAAKFCRFNQSSCPSGWTKYQYWSETTGNSSVFCSNYNAKWGTCNAWYPCNTGSHVWANIPPESAGCGSSGNISATVVKIGCY